MRAAWIALVLLLGAGCVFRNAAEPRFYRPESVALDEAVTEPPDRDGIPLRLRPVHGTPLLRERIVWRASAVEYGRYEQRQWSELPASYVERALKSAFRKTSGVRLIDAPGVATLRVEVVAFDEVLSPTHVAAVSLAVTLDDSELHPLLDSTFHAEEPIASPAPAATATAMGKALDAAVVEVASAAATVLQRR